MRIVGSEFLSSERAAHLSSSKKKQAPIPGTNEVRQEAVKRAKRREVFEAMKNDENIHEASIKDKKGRFHTVG